MSGGVTATTVMAAASAAGAVASIINGQGQQDAAEKARKQAEANARRQESQAQQDFNRANQKSPDTNALLTAAQQSGKSGASGTMLTGSQGVDPSALNLGKNTLLGS